MKPMPSAALAALGLCLAAPAAAQDAAHAVRAIAINDHLTAFYQGRPDEASVPPGPRHWPDLGAIFVGVATYAIHDGDTALVYDTFTDQGSAQWVRDWLTKAGVRRFILATSHWHLDHIGGNAVYADSMRFATEATRVKLTAKRAAIEAGTEEGPPAIRPLILPNIGIAPDSVVTLMIGSVKAELHPVAIHSADGLVIELPDDKLLLAGDTLEDTATFVAEPESLPEQYKALGTMRGWGFTKILPNHGNPAVIASGGYGLGFLDATRDYIRALVEHSHDADFQKQPLENFVDAAVKRGDVSLWWPYRDAHANNLASVAKAWKDKPIPKFDAAP
ncbi:MBL fold metallo-hydrolase [Novosphingobium sediminis]|uniref:MBL fold metallo-hydrolase n=1 Tax=Novosphingobium sediminis TaxID=707214 RepID=A0A512AGU2_9SPHN|nr:MBL fold metallo-hydrolase [Novosphingobium sediminis]GEN98901.1 MBL fold metallo-hydrolase [Novosphingobium sediminis]